MTDVSAPLPHAAQRVRFEDARGAAASNVRRGLVHTDVGLNPIRLPRPMTDPAGSPSCPVPDLPAGRAMAALHAKFQPAG